MEITSVKIKGNGYLVNGSMSVPKAEGNRHYKEVQEWIAEGNTPEPEFTEEELNANKAKEIAQELKQAKQIALDSIKVIVDTKEFDGRDKDQARMLAAIQASKTLGLTEAEWKLADNTVSVVTLADMEQALALSIQEVGRIVKATTIGDIE